jgi:hypothetical protein
VTRLIRIIRKLFAARLKLSSGRNVVISRIAGRNIARLRAMLPYLKTDADASSWLISCLVTNEKGEKLFGLTVSDKAELETAILRMHRRMYGVPLFGRPSETAASQTRSDAASLSVLEFADRYVASEEYFSNAILLAYRSGH